MSCTTTLLTYFAYFLSFYWKITRCNCSTVCHMQHIKIWAKLNYKIWCPNFSKISPAHYGTACTYHDLSWLIKAYHDLSWDIITYHDLSWHIMTYHDLSTYHYLSWLIMAYHDVPWFILAYHDKDSSVCFKPFVMLKMWKRTLVLLTEILQTSNLSSAFGLKSFQSCLNWQNT